MKFQITFKAPALTQTTIAHVGLMSTSGEE